MSTTETELRGPYVGSMMRTTLHWIIDEIYERVVAAGFDDLGRAHVGLFRFPTAEGNRPSEIADRLQVSKQSVNDLLRDLEARGYLVREVDPTDGRARVVRLTDRGRALEAAAYDGAEAAQQLIAERLGARRFAQLRDALQEVSTSIAAGELG